MSLPSVGESWGIGNYRDLMETKMMKSELYNDEKATNRQQQMKFLFNVSALR